MCDSSLVPEYCSYCDDYYCPNCKEDPESPVCGPDCKFYNGLGYYCDVCENYKPTMVCSNCGYTRCADCAFDQNYCSVSCYKDAYGYGSSYVSSLVEDEYLVKNTNDLNEVQSVISKSSHLNDDNN